MTKNEAIEIVGGLSEPGKMPCRGWSIPAKYCHIGSELRKVPGSVCSKCYCCKGRYVFGVVQAALERRFNNYNHPLWVKAMALLVAKEPGYFRWFDSGSVQNLDMMKNIVAVCLLTPHIQHWLPVTEYGIVKSYIQDYRKLPENLTVRFSGYMIDGPAPTTAAQAGGVQTSSVSTKSWTCPAPDQGGKCLACRLCWDKTVANVTYKAH